MRAPTSQPIARAAEVFRYHRRVFIAPPWREIFRQDADRRQDFAEAERTYEAMTETYTELGYELITMPRVPVEERLRFIISETVAARGT